MRARDPIGPIGCGFEAKKLVAAGAFLERPAAVQGGGELANHGAEQGARAEDQLWPTMRCRPEHLGNDGLSPVLQFLQPLVDGMTEEPQGRADEIADSARVPLELNAPKSDGSNPEHVLFSRAFLDFPAFRAALKKARGLRARF